MATTPPADRTRYELGLRTELNAVRAIAKILDAIDDVEIARRILKGLTDEYAAATAGDE